MTGRCDHHTIGWIAGASRPMILGLLAAMALCACDSTREISEKNILQRSNYSSPHASAPVETAPVDASPISKREDGAEPMPIEQSEPVRRKQPDRPTNHVAGAVDVPITLPLRRIDPGAAYLVRTIYDRLDSRDPDAALPASERPIVISLSEIRNQSRARPAEFEAFLDRFAEVLTAAGEAHQLFFANDAEADADYAVLGTAYLLSADGFDWWELFLNLQPSDAAWTLWRCEHPIRVMRHPRPEHQQVFLVPLPRVRH